MQLNGLYSMPISSWVEKIGLMTFINVHTPFKDGHARIKNHLLSKTIPLLNKWLWAFKEAKILGKDLIACMASNSEMTKAKPNAE